MATEVIDQTKLEAVCKNCNKSFAFLRSNLNQIVACRNCGFSSFLTPDRVLKKIPTFSTPENKIKEEKKEFLNIQFQYFRHGHDKPQPGTILEITTSKIRFNTITKLEIGTKAVFTLKNKKFIINIRQSEMVPLISQGKLNTIQYEVVAEFETVLTGEIKEKSYNPHFLIREKK